MNCEVDCEVDVHTGGEGLLGDAVLHRCLAHHHTPGVSMPPCTCNACITADAYHRTPALLRRCAHEWEVKFEVPRGNPFHGKPEWPFSWPDPGTYEGGTFEEDM